MSSIQKLLHKENNRPILVSAAFVIASALLRFYHLEGQSLWNDEWFSIDVARSSLADIQPKLIAFYHHPPLFFYLLHGTIVILGENLWTLRLISAFSGALTTGLVVYITARFTNIRGGVIAGLLCSFGPFHLAYSQEGRPYALAGFLCLVSCYFLLKYEDDDRRSWLAGYVLSTIALLYMHHWGMFVLISQVFVILFSSRTAIASKKILIGAWLAIGLCYIPEMLALLQQAAPHGGNGGGWWSEQPNGGELWNVAEAFSGTYFKMASAIFDSPPLLKIIGGSAIVLLSLLGLIQILRRDLPFVFRGMFICMIGTLLVPFLLSFYRSEIFLWYRYTVIAFPLFCVCAGALCSMKPWRSLASTLAIALVVIGAAGTFRYFSWSKSNVRDVARYAETVTQDSVRLLIRPPYFAPLLNFYYRGSARQLDETYLDQPLGEIVDTAASFAYISLDMPSEIRNYMDHHFDKVSEKTFPGEAHMGMIVGVYKQKPEADEEEEENDN